MKTKNPVTLLIAITQRIDSDKAMDSLEEFTSTAIQLPSIGGFLGLHNDTLLIKSTRNTLNNIINVLKKTCFRRTQYMPLNTADVMQPAGAFPIEVEVGGATIFILDVEHFEEV